MEDITARVRAGVAHVLRTNSKIRAALAVPDATAVDVEMTHIRIPGAPRGTWAGATRPLPVAQLDSTDGVFVMAAKQARSLYLDRQSALVYDAIHPCEAPSAYEALTPNAYIYPSLRCSYYLLGVAWRPFADAAYDDASLVSRFGYLIGHELAHNNLNYAYNTGISELTRRYPCASTRDEAFADILGTLGLLSTGLINSSDACSHVSQTWCARVPIGMGNCMGQSHPLANVRGDALCQTLRDMQL